MLTQSLWLPSGENTEGGQVEGGRRGTGKAIHSRYSLGVCYKPDTVTDTRDSSVKDTAS